MELRLAQGICPDIKNQSVEVCHICNKYYKCDCATCKLTAGSTDGMIFNQCGAGNAALTPIGRVFALTDTLEGKPVCIVLLCLIRQDTVSHHIFQPITL
jgi:hypothetical protein